MTQDKSKGNIVVIVAPSGSGKSTLIKRLRQEIPSLKESVSHTTRPIRPGEVDGVNYFYIAKDEFEQKVESDDFLEWAKVHGNYYGTSKQFVDNEIANGHSILFDLDVQGSDSFRNYFGEKAKIIFIQPPSIEELEKRLMARDTESLEVIQIRLENARREITRKDDYDYCVVNNDLETAYQDLLSVVLTILGGEA
ncbi:MAG: guanylate kinase [Bdellovibrionales bacterium]|jgi:guanylate kinase|nr:guanylate kinase [Bdellovibrionales bacterium]MBT3526216.1 guanylate kinase [Bdellovibrionales bacterium]MBT7668184.1 guanylate kinase [Bdellovibrionales bacterium]MBT7765513.1 guanylate kinase [Bdellovibrionales bacterium]